MLRPIFGAGRATLAILATGLATLALAACADDQLVTSPRAHPNTPGVAAPDITTLASDSTLVTFGAAREGEMLSDGYVRLSGTISCSRDLGESYTVIVTLRQDQRGGDVVSSSQYGRTCPPQAEPFLFYFRPVTSSPSFKRGKAVVTFQVVDGAPSVIRSTASRAVKLAEAK
jgi:hypothetical protein